jgi:hypothetical protein
LPRWLYTSPKCLGRCAEPLKMLTTRLVSNMERVSPGLLHHSLLTAKGGPDILKPLAVCDISWFVVQPALLPIIFFGGCGRWSLMSRVRSRSLSFLTLSRNMPRRSVTPLCTNAASVAQWLEWRVRGPRPAESNRLCR